METPVVAQKAESFGGGEAESKREKPFAATMDVGDLFLVAQEDSAAVLDTGAAATLVCCSRRARHNRILEIFGNPRATTYPSEA